MAMHRPVQAVALSTVFFVFAVLFPATISAQDCNPGDILLSSQVEIDSFQADHGPCDHVTGELKVDGTDISALAGLSGLAQVSRLFIQNNPSLVDLAGLETITRIDTLYISHNENLASIKGLEALEQVGHLTIQSNPSLRNMEGLSSLARVGGNWFEIRNNSSLESLDGLESLETIAGTLTIEDNNTLTNIDGLSSLTMVTVDPVYNVEIQRNAALLNLDGLSSLTELQGGLIIHLNDSLSDIRGLANISEIGALLHIAANPALASLEGLQSLTHAGGLGIVNNATLSDVSSLSSLEALNAWLEISFNPVLADCQALVALIDPVDDFQPGPGAGDIPDIVDSVRFLGNSKNCNSVNAILGEAPLMAINAGLNDAWFNPETNGQGFLIIAFPQISQMFMAWFTYDTERPPADVLAILGEPGHRWLTAQGEYEDNVAGLDAHITSGGVFDSPDPVPVTEPDGEILLEFDSCNSGTLTYDIPSIGRQGVVPIERTTLDNVPLCYLLDKQ